MEPKLFDPSTLNPPMNITLVQDGSGLEKLKRFRDRKAASADRAVGFDTETTFVKDFWFRRVRTLQLGDKEEQFVIDLLPFAGSPEKLEKSQGMYGVYNEHLYKPIFDVINPIICSNDFLKVGVSLSFEYEVMLWNFNQRIWNLYSAEMAERTIQAGILPLKRMVLFSMREMMLRYYGVTIDKEEQEGFTLNLPLTDKQVLYAALDTRYPIALRAKQMEILNRDRLLTTATIENDAIGSYTDMHITGQNLDDDKWLKKIEKVRAQRIGELQQLDQAFIPIVGHKDKAWDDAEIARLEKIWKEDFEKATLEEVDTASKARLEKDPVKKQELRNKLAELQKQRKEKKAKAREAFSTLSKERTAKKKIYEKCEGEAFLNYASPPQLLEALRKLPGFKGLESTSDDELLKYNDRPFIKILRSYRKGKKIDGTYGPQWTQRWVTKPCKEEGWRHPGDGRLHCRFNQLEAETGRSSSSQPNAQNLPRDDEIRACFICDPPGEDGENCIVTVDMSGAELRIIAELAQAKSWITAFAKGQDVHSVSTEILYPEKWPQLALPNCKYYMIGPDGGPFRHKCDCPEHKKLRDETKATNFLLCYGGGPDALADEIGVSLARAKEILENHSKAFPDVWGYLYRSGERAKQFKEARDLYGRRRAFPDPTPETARQWFIDNEPEKLELEDEVVEANLSAFKMKNFRNPTKEEMFFIKHREPNDRDIRQAYRAMQGSISRQGKNHCIQGTNVSIIKRAMGCGFDKNGVPYLWHTLPKYKARIQNMVHDELVIHCPKKYGEEVAALVGDAFKRAAAEVMHLVTMEHEAHISYRWMK